MPMSEIMLTRLQISIHDDVMSDIQHLVNEGKRPVRVRMSKASFAAVGHTAMADNNGHRYCGLFVYVDPEWEAAPVVETIEDIGKCP